MRRDPIVSIQAIVAKETPERVPLSFVLSFEENRVE
jgi:hypothetical protein